MLALLAIVRPCNKKLWLQKGTAVDFECTYGLGQYLFTGIWEWEYFNMSYDMGLGSNYKERYV